MKSLLLKISPKSICSYTVDPLKTRSKLQELTALDNLSKAYKGGVMTDPVAKRLKSMLNVWLTGIFNEKERLKQFGQTTKVYPVFLTLTLSKMQVHDDNFIKRELLMRYIETLKSKYGVINYYWRAEKKLDKRIHFHLIIDKFVHWKQLRQEWNYQQSKYEYHNPIIIGSSDLGCNSIDVDKINSGEACANYVTKYVCKSEDEQPIIGRIWGCSTALHALKPCVVVADANMLQSFVKIVNSPLVYVKKEDTYSIITFKNKNTLKTVSYELHKIWCSHCENYYRNLYFGSPIVQPPFRIQNSLSKFKGQYKEPEKVVDTRIKWDLFNTHEIFENERKVTAMNEFCCMI
jgi:hypothetical protein